MRGEQTTEAREALLRRFKEKRTGLRSRSLRSRKVFCPDQGWGGGEVGERRETENRIKQRDGRKEGEREGGGADGDDYFFHTPRFFSVRISFRRNQWKIKQKP